MTTALATNTPAPSRRNAPATSVAAAATVLTGKARINVLRVLFYAGVMGLTDFELRDEAAKMGIPMSWSGASARRIELVRGGWVQDTYTTRLSSYGNDATVWMITQKGINDLVAMKLV